MTTTSSGTARRSLLLLTASLTAINENDAFPLSWMPLIRPGSRNSPVGGDGGLSGSGGGGPPWNLRNHFDDGNNEDGRHSSGLYLFSACWFSSETSGDSVAPEIDDEDFKSQDSLLLATRGGGTTTETQRQGKGTGESSSGSTMRNAIGSIRSKISGLNLPRPFQKSEDAKAQEALMKMEQQQEELLSTTVVDGVSAPTSTLLPPEIITQFASESNLIGGTLNPESLEGTANNINRWYWDHGFVMNSVTGAILVPKRSGGDENGRSGHVELKVREVKVADNRPGKSPVAIRFVDPCNSDESGEDDKIISLPTRNGQQQYKITPGRTRASKIARMVKLDPGSHFQILPQRWSRLVATAGGAFGGGGGKSAIFSTIHAVRPIPSTENTATLEIIASENKPYAALEYGVTKSMYSDQWEGELDLKHGNAFGGGETFSLNVRKGKHHGNVKPKNQKEETSDLASIAEGWNVGLKSGPVSWRMSIKDDSLAGSDTGYDLELFRDYIGDAVDGNLQKPASKSIHSESAYAQASNDGIVYPQRTGATLRFRLPPPPQSRRLQALLKPRVASASIERIRPTNAASPKDGSSQSIASLSMNVGPYYHVRKNDYNGTKSTPKTTKWADSLQNLRSRLSGTVTAGARWDGINSAGCHSDGRKEGPTCALPYASGTITSQQTLPLVFLGAHKHRTGSPSIDLAMQHVISASTRNLPRHEAVLLGLASRVRGYRYNFQSNQVHTPPKEVRNEKQFTLGSLKQFVCGGRVGRIRPPIAIANAISGSVELRIPSEPGTVVLFGDWALSNAQNSNAIEGDESISIVDKPLRVSSIGVGFRKIIQGIPIKVDACVTEHGTAGMFFSIGNDFGL